MATAEFICTMCTYGARRPLTARGKLDYAVEMFVVDIRSLGCRCNGRSGRVLWALWVSVFKIYFQALRFVVRNVSGFLAQNFILSNSVLTTWPRDAKVCDPCMGSVTF